MCFQGSVAVIGQAVDLVHTLLRVFSLKWANNLLSPYFMGIYSYSLINSCFYIGNEAKNVCSLQNFT